MLAYSVSPVLKVESVWLLHNFDIAAKILTMRDSRNKNNLSINNRET
jgi:hypothetical protein